LSYLQLPQHVAAAARQLLASVIEAKRSSDPPRPTTPVTLAATLYLAAREQGYALSLGAAGAAFSTNPIHVSREFRWDSSSSSSLRVPPTLPPTVPGRVLSRLHQTTVLAELWQGYQHLTSFWQSSAVEVSCSQVDVPER
jgi:hypothetical protein